MLRNSSTTSEKTRLLYDKGTQSSFSFRDSKSSYGSIFFDLPVPKIPRFLCTKRDTIIVTVAFLILVIILTASLSLGLPALEEKERLYYNPVPFVSNSELLTYQNATVITDGQLCADIGKNILEKGGHVVDAAIASVFCTSVVNPESTGLGGGFIMIVHSKDDKSNEAETKVIDARETAPMAATEDMFSKNSTLSQIGGLAIAIPSLVKGLWDAHKKYGKLEWPTLIEPSIKICKEGFNVSEHMAEKLNLIKDHVKNNENMRNLFTNNATDKLYKANELFKNPELAKTLEIIASGKKGVENFYEGDLSKTLIEDIKNCNGIITAEDLKNYETRTQDPLKINLETGENVTLYTVPPPGSGAILTLIMLIMDGYNISKQSMENLNDKVQFYHHFIEAMKFGFAYRSQITDDDQDAGLAELIKNLTKKKFADKLREKISDSETRQAEYYTDIAEKFKEDAGTSHVSVYGSNGDAVSVTSTINTYFGSMCVSPSTGVIFNNEMDDFSSPNVVNYFGLEPSKANRIKPGRRPLSSLTPAIVVDNKGKVKLISGAAGGTRIISATAQAIIRMLFLNEDVKMATDAARIHHQLFPGKVFFEKKFPQVYKDKLFELGHVFSSETHDSSFLGIVKQEQIHTVLDYRRGGSVSGF